MNGLKYLVGAFLSLLLVLSSCGSTEYEPEMPDNQTEIAGRSEANPDTVWMSCLFGRPLYDGSLFYDYYDYGTFTPSGEEWGVTNVFTDDTERRMPNALLTPQHNRTISFDEFDIRSRDGIIEVVAPVTFDYDGIGQATGLYPTRSLYIELTYPNYVDTVAFIQKGYDYPYGISPPKFVFTPSNAAFNADGGRMVFTITGQPDDGCSYWQFWGTSEEPGLPFEQPNSTDRRGTKTYGWLTVTVDGEHLILDAEPNTTGKYRQKWLRFKVDGPDSWPIGFIVTQSAR